MRLFIANCTRQTQRIYYRLDFNQDGVRMDQSGVMARHQDVPAGRQEPIGGDLHKSQIDSIVDQLRVYGLAGVIDVEGLNWRAPYVFNVDAPVPQSVIEKVYFANQGILLIEGRARREAAAIAASELVVGTDKVTIGLEQVTESELGGEQIAEGFIVDRSEPAPNQPRPPKRNKAA